MRKKRQWTEEDRKRQSARLRRSWAKRKRASAAPAAGLTPAQLAGFGRTKKAPRDTANAVALGMVIGGMLITHNEHERPREWQRIGWDEIVDDVDRTSAALDEATRAAEFWEAHDWYLSLDAIAAALWDGPRGDFSPARVLALCVKS